MCLCVVELFVVACVAVGAVLLRLLLLDDAGVAVDVDVDVDVVAVVVVVG